MAPAHDGTHNCLVHNYIGSYSWAGNNLRPLGSRMLRGAPVAPAKKESPCRSRLHIHNSVNNNNNDVYDDHAAVLFKK